jgi:selenide,water dikinase
LDFSQNNLGISESIMTQPTLKLTSLSSCAGCAAKLSQRELSEVLRGIPTRRDPNLLVGSATADDAGVYRLDKNTALVQTVDFFTPIVDDPFSYGQIAATNAISDVYAMGGRPLTALNIMGIPPDRVPPQAINAILRGGASKAKQAACTIVGGHTIRTPEPIYGLSVTGLVSPRRMLTKAQARPGDLLVLTKPLGTGIATTGIKRGLASPALARKAVQLMSCLNRVGADLAESGLVQAATDVTGFGFFGHLASMCRASDVTAEIHAGEVPAISAEIHHLIEQDCVPGGSRENLRTADRLTDWGSTNQALRCLLTDAQTSGGLLLCVRPARLNSVLKILRQHRTPAKAIVGRIVAAAAARIQVRP